MPDDPSSEGWTDLASTVAGAGIQAEAKALRDAAPVRTFMARVLGVHTDERAYRVGAKGEQLVARQLERLGSSWHVIHSVTLSDTGTDLDHLVTGPAGVFSLNAKNHPDGKVWVAGDNVYVNGHRPEHNYVRASRSEGHRVARLLTAACGFKVDAIPVVVIVNAIDLEVKEQPVDVRICSRRRVVDWLAAQPRTLAPERVEAIFSIARRSATWRTPPKAVVHDEMGTTTPVEPVTETGGHEQHTLVAEVAPIRAVAVAASSDKRLTSPPEMPAPVGATKTALVVKHTAAKGTTLLGDPRPHTKLVSRAGLRWSAPQRLWYLPDSRDVAPQADLIAHLAHDLRGAGFEVTVEVTG